MLPVIASNGRLTQGSSLTEIFLQKFAGLWAQIAGWSEFNQNSIFCKVFCQIFCQSTCSDGEGITVCDLTVLFNVTSLRHNGQNFNQVIQLWIKDCHSLSMGEGVNHELVCNVEWITISRRSDPKAVILHFFYLFWNGVNCAKFGGPVLQFRWWTAQP